MREETWVTIAVTPLPLGWVNVIEHRETGALETSPAPALLLQELREEPSRSCTCDRQPPGSGETRVVFATSDEGSVQPAEDRWPGTYITSTTADDFASWSERTTGETA
jgi:hypothetical protein